jgi:hypothetical protein
MSLRRRATPALAFTLILCSFAAAQTLSYVERSTGLNQPGMEGGNTELEFGDVNGDGHPDLVSVGDHGNPYVNTNEHGIMVWFGNGAGTWSVFQYGNFGYGGLALGDVNGDGLMDIGYGIHHNYAGQDLGDQILEVALGDGTGHSWTPWDNGLATNGEDWGMFGCDFADVDNDGDLDLGSISFGCCAGVHVYRNNGDGTWTQTWGFVGGNSNLHFVFGDINGDGFADFAADHGNGTVWLGNGAGGFTLADGNLPAPVYKSGISLGDVNDDGRADLAFATSTGVGVYSWLAPGQWQNLSGNLASIGAVQLTQIADMNLDGHGDLIAMYLGQVRVYTGDGQGHWTLATTVTTPAACDYAAFRAGTDIDHNGYPDFAFVAEENCQPWVGGVNHLHCFAEASVPTAPTLYPKFPRGGERFHAGSVHFIDWHAGVPAGQGSPTVDIAVSVRGPDGPFQPVATAVPNNGRYQWSVRPTLVGSDCYLRLTLNATSPVTVTTPNAFEIPNLGPSPLCDMNCDGLFNFDDINPFVLALSDPEGYAAAYPACDYYNGDCNFDGRVDFDDINCFLQCNMPEDTVDQARAAPAPRLSFGVFGCAMAPLSKQPAGGLLR